MKPVCIVGGGPAGLGVAHALRHAGIAFRLFDAGPPLEDRRHDCADELGAGIGGAGLFSDGKFSYFPSGTYLYELDDRDRLASAYGGVARMLDAAGISAPPFPTTAPAADANGHALRHKSYASQYGSLAQRRQLTRMLAGDDDVSVSAFCRVERITRMRDGFAVAWRDQRVDTVRTEHFAEIVLATGRFGGGILAAQVECDLPLADQRYEVGIRIEHRNEVGFLPRIKNNDVKLISHHDGVEVRTFCTCRHGEVWHIPYDGVSALSGRSDGPHTDYSNFGLLPRFSGATRAQGRAVWQHFCSTSAPSRQALWQPLTEFISDTPVRIDGMTLAGRPWHPRDNFVRGRINDRIHGHLRHILVEAIAALLAQYPDMNSPDTVCLFPAIEGAGVFPVTDGELRARDGIWCCGDVVGRFRGLVPALVSGQYVGRAIAERRIDHARRARAEVYESS